MQILVVAWSVLVIAVISLLTVWLARRLRKHKEFFCLENPGLKRQRLYRQVCTGCYYTTL